LGAENRVEWRMEAGDAATEIIRVAQETPTDLIVMGTAGRTGLWRLLRGSVAEQVIRKAACPVLTVKASRSRGTTSTWTRTDEASLLDTLRTEEITTILHPTDFSESSQAAFQLACALARDHGARVIAFHGVPRPESFSGEALAGTFPGDYHTQHWEALRNIRPSYPEVGITHRLDEGDPTTLILQAARASRCDLIVMGTHGRTGLKRLLMGSVADQVVRKAPCPVLTVKAPCSRTLTAETVRGGEEQLVRR
jgi:nucleotide-binding universal stress UspA family protein